MKLILDIENSITRREDGSIDNSPFNSSNQLVSVGFKEVNKEHTYYFVFNHNELTLSPEGIAIQQSTLQFYLNNCTLLIGHNIKYDLKWLLSCGFTYDGEVYDTMVHDYVLLRGMKQGLSLEACLQRHGLESTKSSALKDYYAQGLNTNEIPLAELIEYGKNDVVITEALYNSQQLELQSKEPDRLRQYTMAMKLMNDFLPVLVDMELAGVKLDIDYLNLLDAEYTQELEILENKLHMEVQKVMGDRPINLSSTDHKSQLLFSRVVTNKNKWKEVFNLGAEERNSVKKKKTTKQYPPQQFARYLKEYTYPVYKTKARKCTNCDGKGHFYRTKKDGTNYSKATKCPVCNGTGVEQVLTQDIAGLQLVPLNRNVSAAGFSSDSDVIEYYLNHPRTKSEALPLLKHINRYNKLSTWKNTFIAQLLKFHHNTILHASYNQCVTATGRLSCTEPNLQNQPARDPEFKIKKAFISRWKGGCITDADFGQLEFRIAAYLSQCPNAIKAVVDGLDIHSMTRDFYHGKLEYKPSVIQPTMTRQQAKAHCVPMDTLILTRSGWKDYHTLVVGEEVLAYNQELDQTEWTPVLDKVRHSNIPVMELSTEHNWSVRCTTNHRWYGTKRQSNNGSRSYFPAIVEAQHINSEHRITVSARAEGGGSDCSPEIAALIGWLYSDGSVHFSEVTGKTSQGSDGRRAGAMSCIIQKKYKEEVNDVLFECNVIPTRLRTRECDTTVWSLSADDTRRVHREAGLNLRNPNFVEWVLSLSIEARASFLEAVFLAEGHTREYNIKCISQNVGSFQEAIHLAAFMEGHDVRLTHCIGYTGNDCVRMTLRNKRHVTGQRIQKSMVSVEDVWCPRTKLGTWVMKQGDTVTITGNTFGPLYGKYTEWTTQFYALFPGIKAWHDRIMKEVVETGELCSPSGRVYAFKGTQWFVNRRGERLASGHTQIKNYTVQGFATGDIVLLVLIDIWRYLKKHNAKSKLILQVHDSAATDTHPDEYQLVEDAYRYAFDNVYTHAKERWGLDINIPLAFDLSRGYNWNDTVNIEEFKGQ